MSRLSEKLRGRRPHILNSNMSVFQVFSICLRLAGIVKTRNLTPMKVTLELPDEWAASFPARETEWAEVVTAGLHRRQSRLRQEINHFADMADTLAELPSPEQVLALHPSPALAERIQFLLAKKNDAGLTPDETAEWDEIMRVEHLMRVAKAKAAFKLKADGAAS